jgi:hypothetical protein
LWWLRAVIVVIAVVRPVVVVIVDVYAMSCLFV